MSDKKVVMILQSTSGKTQSEINETYTKAAAALVLNGYKVYNPNFAWNTEQLKQNGIKNIKLHQLAKEFESISKCDAIYFCDGWQEEDKLHWLLFIAVACDVEILNESETQNKNAFKYF